MTNQNTPDFGDIKVVRNGSAPGPVANTVVPLVPTNGVVAEAVKPQRSSLARYWWLPLLLILGIGAVVWGRNYYQDRYVGSDFWAQVPATQNTTPVERLDLHGNPTGVYGVEYVLTAFNEAGEQRELTFVSRGDVAAAMPQPGTYIWLSASSQLVIRQRAVPQSEVPASVLVRLQALHG